MKDERTVCFRTEMFPGVFKKSSVGFLLWALFILVIIGCFHEYHADTGEIAQEISHVQ